MNFPRIRAAMLSSRCLKTRRRRLVSFVLYGAGLLRQLCITGGCHCPALALGSRNSGMVPCPVLPACWCPPGPARTTISVGSIAALRHAADEKLWRKAPYVFCRRRADRPFLLWFLC